MKLIKFIGNRETLDTNQKNFLIKVIPITQLIQIWSIDKADFNYINSPSGILPSVTLSEMIIQSHWGSHPLSKEEFNKRYSNNLTLLEYTEFWHGKKHKFEGNTYRAYRDWGAFCVDFTDHIVFSDLFTELLETNQCDKQIEVLAQTKLDPKIYQAKAEATVDFYNLQEFDY